MAARSRMSRDELEAEARERGQGDPSAFRTKADLIEALEALDAEQWVSSEFDVPNTTDVGQDRTFGPDGLDEYGRSAEWWTKFGASIGE